MSNIISQVFNFNNKEIRSSVHNGQVYWSVVDVIESLLESGERPRQYWSDLKNGHNQDTGIQLYGKIVQLKLEAADGKMYLTDCATQENIFYIIQFVPSSKANKFKEQFAKIVNERIEEEKNPSLAIDRIVRVYKNRGMTDDWIQKRFKAIVARNNLTDTLKEHGIKAYEYAKTTNILYKHSVGMDADEYKEYKGLEKKDKLRDNFSVEELELSDMTERFLKAQIKKNDSQGFDEIKEDAKVAGNYGARIREIMEEALGKSIITKKQDLIEEGE